MSDIYAPLGTKGSWDITGTAGNDNLYGGKGDNRFDGGAGNDTMYPLHAGYPGDSSTNYFNGGEGVDTVVLERGFSHWQFDFDAATGTYKADNITLKNVEYVDFGDVRMKVEDAANREGTQHQYSNGDDQLIGNDFGYTLSGELGNDTFTGNGGDDTLYGGKGEDTAIFRGNRADYKIVYDYDRFAFVVTDRQAGRDGQDHVHSIESLKFADATIHFDFASELSSTPTDADLAKVDGTIGTPVDWSLVTIAPNGPEFVTVTLDGYITVPPGDGIYATVTPNVVEFVTVTPGGYITVPSADGGTYAIVPLDVASDHSLVALAGVQAFETAGAHGFAFDHA